MKRSLLSLLFMVFISALFAQERVYTPTLKSPADNAKNRMPNDTISWNAISGSLNLSYEVQLDTSNQFNSPLKVDTTLHLLTGFGTNLLMFGKTYYWRVRAIDGETSGWSSTWNFTVFNRVELSKLPDSSATGMDASLSVYWLSAINSGKKKITGITYYEYQVDTDTNFNSSGLIHGTTTPSKYNILLQNLRFGQKYYWRVRAGHQLGHTAYSYYHNFTVIDNFSLQTPANNATKVFLNTALTWKAVNGLLVYGYQIATDAAFTHLVIESEVDTVAVKTTSGRMKSVTASYLTFGIKYYWRVRGRHVSDTSVWSSPFSFTSINTVDLKTPTNNQINVSVKPILTWTKQTGIDNYEIAVSSDSLFTSLFLSIKPAFGDVQYQVGKQMTNNKRYFWRMRAYSDGDTSNWSPVWAFQTTTGTGINENTYGTFTIYPNPTTGKIFLKVDSRENQTVKFEVIDLLGKTIMEKEIDVTTGLNVHEIVLENVNKGIYLVRLNINGSYLNQKIIVEK